MKQTTLKVICASALIVAGAAPALALPPRAPVHVPPQGIRYERIPLSLSHPNSGKPRRFTDLSKARAQSYDQPFRSALPPLDRKARTVEGDNIEAESARMREELDKQRRSGDCVDALSRDSTTCIKRRARCRSSAFPVSTAGSSGGVVAFGDPYCFLPAQPGSAKPTFRFIQNESGQWLAIPTRPLPSAGN